MVNSVLVYKYLSIKIIAVDPLKTLEMFCGQMHKKLTSSVCLKLAFLASKMAERAPCRHFEYREDPGEDVASVSVSQQLRHFINK